MIDKLNEIRNMTDETLGAASTAAEVEALRVKVLGRKGEMTQLLKSLGTLPPEERKEVGKKANEIRDFITERIDEVKTRLESADVDAALKAETIDVTLPGKQKTIGRLHPISVTHAKLENLLVSLGFDIVEGPHIETIYHNFDALNAPQNHPTRDEQDTFYIDNGFVLRTHTSPVQIRTMESRKPPIRIAAPGKTFRRDEIDATHTPAFHQMEGLVVDKGVTFGDLKGILEIMAKYIFGEGTKIRLRPSFFPFTEPSAEVDITCFACVSAKSGNREPRPGCSICKGSGWVELWGCGMVHPEVLRLSGIDPNVYSGYAFGLGTDRITSALHGITDPRLYFENDVQFLSQF